jgi:hypothetical protein
MGIQSSWAGQTLKTVDEKQWVASQDYYDMIAAGKIPNHFPLHKFGFNAAVGNAEEIIWTAGNGYTYLTTAEKLKVSSDGVEDDVGGDGALTVTLEGLDSNWDLISDTVIMTGAVAVETNVAFLRVFRAYVATAGVSETNEGLISINDNADLVTMAEIAIGRGQTQMAMWTVPADHELFLYQLNAAESANKKTIIRLYAKDNAVANSAWRLQDETVVNLGDSTRIYKIPLKFTEKTDIEIRGVAANPSGIVNAGFQAYYEVEGV